MRTPSPAVDVVGGRLTRPCAPALACLALLLRPAPWRGAPRAWPPASPPCASPGRDRRVERFVGSGTSVPGSAVVDGVAAGGAGRRGQGAGGELVGAHRPGRHRWGVARRAGAPRPSDRCAASAPGPGSAAPRQRRPDALELGAVDDGAAAWWARRHRTRRAARRAPPPRAVVGAPVGTAGGGARCRFAGDAGRWRRCWRRGCRVVALAATDHAVRPVGNPTRRTSLRRT